MTRHTYMPRSRLFKCERFIKPTDLMQYSLAFAKMQTATITTNNANVRWDRPWSKFLNAISSVPIFIPMRPRQPPTAIDDRTPRITVV